MVDFAVVDSAVLNRELGHSQDRVLNSDKITVHINASVEDAFGNKKGQLAGLHIVENSGIQAPSNARTVLYLQLRK